MPAGDETAADAVASSGRIIALSAAIIRRLALSASIRHNRRTTGAM